MVDQVSDSGGLSELLAILEEHLRHFELQSSDIAWAERQFPEQANDYFEAIRGTAKASAQSCSSLKRSLGLMSPTSVVFAVFQLGYTLAELNHSVATDRVLLVSFKNSSSARHTRHGFSNKVKLLKAAESLIKSQDVPTHKLVITLHERFGSPTPKRIREWLQEAGLMEKRPKRKK